MKGALIATAVLAAVGFGIYVMAHAFGTDPHRVPFMLEKSPAPPFRLKRLDNGEQVTLSDLKGKPLVLNFWATWCVPCKYEHPVLEWAAKNYAGKANFVGIVFEDSEANTKKFLNENGWSLMQLFDAKSTVAVDYAVAGVPETYFITKDGMIALKKAEPLSEVTLSAALSQVLDDPALEKQIAEVWTQVEAQKFASAAKDEVGLKTYVRGLVTTGMGPAQVLESVKRADAQLQARQEGH